MDTSWYEIVDLAVLPENLLDGDSTTDEETEDETEKTSGVGTLCSVEVQKISEFSFNPIQDSFKKFFEITVFPLKNIQNYLIIMHDVTVDRTTNGKGKVHELALAQLRGLDAGQGQPVPTLDELFEAQGKLTAASGRPFIFNVEVTNYATPNDGLEEAVVALTAKAEE